MNFLPIPTILIIFVSTLVDFSAGANVLVNAPTMLADHFLSMKKLAKFLVEHDKQVHVVMQTKWEWGMRTKHNLI
jgi:hypothetical protein